MIVYHLEQESHEISYGVVELDESYFGGIRKGKRGRSGMLQKAFEQGNNKSFTSKLRPFRWIAPASKYILMVQRIKKNGPQSIVNPEAAEPLKFIWLPQMPEQP